MKLLIVTIVDEFQNDIFKMLKQAEVLNFSKLDIEGFKTSKSLQMATTWFPSSRNGSDSEMFFSFIEDEKIDKFFSLIEEFNKTLETNNPVHAIVVPVERYI